MSTLSANQLYNLSGAEKTGTKFKDWFNSERAQYQAKIDAGKITGRMPFKEWLNKRWAVKASMNAEGDATVKSTLLDALKNVGTQVLDKTINKGSTTATTDEGKAPGQVLQEKRILGMKPAIAYTIGGVLALGVTVTAILLIRKAKKAA